MNSRTNEDRINDIVVEGFARSRDVTPRDGVQSWDGNKLPHAAIERIGNARNKLARVEKQYGITPQVETSGGGQHAQPALFMGEDPNMNLKDIKEVMPDCELQLLWRGRNGLGFRPISPEIQRLAVESAAEKGIKRFRVFDMMNDPENLQTTFDALNDYKKKHPEKAIVVEGALSYISPPENAGKRAWKLSDYADYAVTLAQMGADEITIKNYAGVGDREMPELTREIRNKLDKAGFRDRKINLHDHGEKPDVLLDTLKAGADKVDVAIGDLSGGPSHTNLRNLIYTKLKREGFNPEKPEVKEVLSRNPLLLQLSEVENAVAEEVNRKTAGRRSLSFKEKRGILNEFTQEDADRYRMAGGALSDLWGRIDNGHPLHPKYSSRNRDAMSDREKQISLADPKFAQKRKFFRVLERAVELWEKGGQFNTVTPGAKILTEQALQMVDREDRASVPANMTRYTDDYMNIVTGRFGRNKGIEEGGEQAHKFRDALLMFRALREINHSHDIGDIKNPDDVAAFLNDAVGRVAGEQLLRKGGANARIELSDAGLESLLMDTDIEHFKAAVKTSAFSDFFKGRLQEMLTPGRSPDRAEGIEVGREKVQALRNQGIDVDELPRVSRGDDLALNAMLLPDEAFKKVIATANESRLQVIDPGANWRQFMINRSAAGEAGSKYRTA